MISSDGISKELLLEKVYKAGVVGAGGAGFPTHIKLNCNPEIIIVNGAECEPLLAVDQSIMINYPTELVETLGLLKYVLGAEQACFAIKSKHKEPKRVLEGTIDSNSHVDLIELGDYYPAGDEQILVYEVTGKIIPEGGIPINKDIVVINVETLLNIYNALRDKPVISTFVTVTGSVNSPYTAMVPVGITMGDLLYAAGGPNIEDWSLIQGGPMMGNLVKEDEIVTKTTKGLIVLPSDHILVQSYSLDLKAALIRARATCCQCRLCTDLCPRYLLGHELNPHRVLNAVNHMMSRNSSVLTQAFLCCECGVCDLYACPMELSPRMMYKELKRTLSASGIKNNHKLSPSGVRWARSGRRVPTGRLVSRLGLSQYVKIPAPCRKIMIDSDKTNLPLSQHIGMPAEVGVKVGDRVSVGDIVASVPYDNVGSVVISPVCGIVESVDRKAIVIRDIKGDAQ